MDKQAQWKKLTSSARPGIGQVPSQPERSAFQQDYDRIVFTSAFRRLKDKTQVFPLSKSDYVRTRLTHSLEASCVGRSLGNLVGRHVIERHGLEHIEASDFGAIVGAACLAHDIGNPPFGHAGEDAIREWFKSSGLLSQYQLTPAEHADLSLYEGNAQGFRILTRLQNASNEGGLQLTSATLAAFSKYPCASAFEASDKASLPGNSVKKFGFFQHDAESFKQVAENTGLIPRIAGQAWQRHPLAFLVEAADDICYLIIDLEDAARLGYVSYDEARGFLEALSGDKGARKEAKDLYDVKENLEYLRAKTIGYLIDHVVGLFMEKEDQILDGSFDGNLLDTSTEIKETWHQLKEFSSNHIYTVRPALEIETAGFEVLGGLLSLFVGAIETSVSKKMKGEKMPTKERMLLELLPLQFLDSIDANKQRLADSNPYIRFLQAADFVSGMTDSYAVNLYRKLKGIDLPA